MHQTVIFLFVLLACLTKAQAQHDNAVQIAQKVGLPGLTTNSQTAGPFLGEQNTIFYINKSGLITYFHPTQYFAYFGKLQDEQVVFKYMLSPQGQYVVNHSNQAEQVNVLPNDVFHWPHANAVAQVLIKYLTAIKEGQINAPDQTTDWNTLSQISADMHKSTMSILGNMGNEGCTQYYDGVYYLGCW